MKKVFTLIFLFGFQNFSLAAESEWKHLFDNGDYQFSVRNLHKNKDGTVTLFLKKDSNLRQVSISTISLYDFDCMTKEAKSITLQIDKVTGKDLPNRPNSLANVINARNGQWHFVMPSTEPYKVMQYACSTMGYKG